MNDPFKSTALWTALLNHLKSNILTKKYRHRLRSYEQSFTGTEAVDVVFKFLTENSSTFLNDKVINRENAVKVCQLLVKENIIESPYHIRNSERTFEDSCAKFYRFCSKTKTETRRSSSSFRRALQQENEEPKSTFYESPAEVIANPYVEPDQAKHFNKSNHRSSIRKLRPGPVLKRLTSFSYLSRSREGSMRIEDKEIKSLTQVCMNKDSDNAKVELTSMCPLKRSWTVATLSASCESLSKKKQHPMNEIHEILLKKLALARLLSLIEVPYLEDLLPLVNDKTDFSYCCASGADVPFLSEMTVYDDKWLSAAQACVDLPLSSCKPAVSWSKKEWKKAAFKLLVQRLRKNKAPFLPVALQTVFLQIYSLLKENKTEIALQALQLACLFLTRDQRIKLRNVLVFMNIVAVDQTVQLNKNVSNQHAVMRELVPHIMNFSLLGPEQAFITIYFMFKQYKTIFHVPTDLWGEVERIFNSNIDVDFASAGFSSCEKISLDAYEKQKKQTTDASLRELLEMKFNDRLVSSREKSKWLHKFQKTHAEIYNSYLK